MIYSLVLPTALLALAVSARFTLPRTALTGARAVANFGRFS
jgi:hypothetical protein